MTGRRWLGCTAKIHAGLVVLSLAFGLCAGLGSTDQAVLQQADRLETQGHFAEAAAALNAGLELQGNSAAQKNRLEFELDRLRRIRLDFPFTESSLFTELKKHVKHLTRSEFDQWVREGRFDSREIDGQRFFMAASVSNLFFRYPELLPRRRPSKDHAAMERRHLQVCEQVKSAALAEHQPYVTPKRFEVTMLVTANAGAAPAGQTIRAWLPIPRHYPFQSGFQLLFSSSPALHVDDETSPARSLYLEQPSNTGLPTEFKVSYEYEAKGVWFGLNPAEVKPCDTNDLALKPFVEEAEHVQFTPEMRALSQKIAGTETNPCAKAKRFYEWIAGNIKYSYAIEYSTIRNIGEYCRSRGYGDCGQEGLLFITLCRLNGIPARWQSGWTIFPGAKSIHDWTEIYLAPYGWVPVDPYMGIYATRYCTSLTPAQRGAMRDFYFGGLDPYRLIANSNHNQPLTPSKNSMRSDNVDFQRGELEWGTNNIYFDQFSYDVTAKELPADHAKIE